ncbi:monocarboxylate transporter 12 [Nilaparvata lugens]|uniref:monocarboxylate transporter 12 n=1 Tax=Nilaparvata lugens TaxID=108931 RepID=UPI00193E36F2|nr:monocarboxylate transporter 12 [Nilaparvata lugens]
MSVRLDKPRRLICRRSNNNQSEQKHTNNGEKQSDFGVRVVKKIKTPKTKSTNGNKTESECSCSEELARLTDGTDGHPPSPPPGGAEGAGAAEGADAVSYCEYHDIPPPPDGGYGWVVVFASFMCNLIVDGIAYTFGVFMPRFVSYYGVGKGTVAWVGSLLSGMYLSAGPVVSALTNKYGCRTVCITGSIISCVAFVLSTFSPSVEILMVTYGVIGGIGFGLIYLPAVVCVGYYFETKRSLATGIAVCGSGVGTFAFAPLATLLLDNFDWKGANLILAGLILNCAVFGAMMRPLEFPKGPSCKPLLLRMADEKRFQMERGSIGGSYFIVQLPDGSQEKRMKMPINIDPGVHSSFNLDQLVPGTPITPVPTMAVLPTITEAKAPDQSGSSGNSSSGSTTELKKDDKSQTKPAKSEADVDKDKEEVTVVKRVRKESATGPPPVGVSSPHVAGPPGAEGGKGGGIPRNASQPAFTTHVNLPKNGSVPFFDRIRKTSAGERYKPSLQAIKVSRGGTGNMNSNGEMRKSLHLRLSSQSTIGGSRNNNCEEMWSKTEVSHFYINSFTMFLFIHFIGVAPGDASFLLSIIGITNTVGRVVCGWVADFPWVNSMLLNNISLVISTIAVTMTPFCHTYSAYVTMSIFFGIAIAGYISLTSIILVDLLGLDKLTNAFGLLILFRGAAAIFGSPLAGAVYDATGSYDIPFFMAGAFFFVSTITSFMAPVLKQCQTPEEAPVVMDALTPIDEDEEEEDDDEEEGEGDEMLNTIPEIVETAPSPSSPVPPAVRGKPPIIEIKQIESVL